MLDLAVIIVSWNVRDYLADCLRSVYAELERLELESQVWVVDNASTDGTQDLLADLFPTAHLVLNGHNPGFGAANNQAMRAAAQAGERGPRYYLLLNPDTLVRPGAIHTLVRCLDERPQAGLAGARLVYGDGRFQHSAFNFPGLRQLAFDLWPMPARLYESRLNGRYARRCYRTDSEPFEVDHTLGAAMLVRRQVVDVTGGFDESFHMYCEEIDWCWRIREAGWSVYTVPRAEIVHFGGESTRQIRAQSIIQLWRSRALLYQRHHGRLKVVAARWLVQSALKRKANQSPDPELQQAYEQAATVWKQGAMAMR